MTHVIESSLSGQVEKYHLRTIFQPVAVFTQALQASAFLVRWSLTC